MRINFLKKDSPLILVLKIENTNEYPVKANFEIDYFWQALRKASSGLQSYQIGANKTIKDRLRDLGFDKSMFTDEQIRSRDFMIGLSSIEIVKQQ